MVGCDLFNAAENSERMKQFWEKLRNACDI